MTVQIKHKVDFPVHALDFTTDDLLIAGGGGGANMAGVKNHLVSFKVDTVKGKLAKVDSLLLSELEDCPMSLACHPRLPLVAAGINSMVGAIAQGKNQNCRLFNTENGKLEIEQTLSTSASKDTEAYQKVTRFSRSGNYLATGFSDGKVSVLNTTSWKCVFPPIRFKDVQDLDFDKEERHVAIATSTALIVLDMEGTLIQVIDSPKLNKNTTCEIRACRYSDHKGQQTLYAIVNPTTRGRGFICAWKLRAKRPYPVTKTVTRGISRKSITSFAISPTGQLLAYASTDLSIGLIDAQQLKTLLKIDKAHSFAITSLVFNNSGQLLASAGVDNCCKIIKLPEQLKRANGSSTVYIFLDMLLFALWMHILVQMVEN